MPAKKETITKKKVAKGDAYECGVCGMSIIVDEPCGCEDTCDIMCCGEPMKEKKAKVKTAK